jgi:hypothetical protein
LQPTKQLAGLVSGNTARYSEDDATHVILIAGPPGGDRLLSAYLQRF